MCRWPSGGSKCNALCNPLCKSSQEVQLWMPNYSLLVVNSLLSCSRAPTEAAQEPLLTPAARAGATQLHRNPMAVGALFRLEFSNHAIDGACAAVGVLLGRLCRRATPQAPHRAGWHGCPCFPATTSNSDLTDHAVSS